jgi:hypothetical protein
VSTVSDLGEAALRRLGVAIVPVAERPPMTATVAVATLATAALTELGVIASDETPSATDQALAVQKVGAVHMSLVSQGFVPWADTAIPNAVSEEYTKLAAALMATSFGKQADLAMYQQLEARVRTVAMVLRAPDLATAAVQAVHDDLVARGRARWSVFDIPAAAERPYVYLAANQLAPLFGQQPSQADEAGAIRSLAQIIALPSSGETVQVGYF